ncbi:MAG: SPOR domain-containing protein [Gemmatimonadota bacterium]
MIRLLKSVALGIALLATAAPALAQRNDPAELLESGRRAYDDGDYAKARVDLWEYLDATASLSGPSRLPQADALFLIARMEPAAAVAAQHYQTIATEYPAATVADEALLRLGQYALVTGRPEEARERFTELKQNYPFSRLQGEIPLWVGRTFLAEQRYRAATDALIEGFSNVRTGNLPQELSVGQRDALAAEYAYWLGTAFSQEGDQGTAFQYWSLLTLDYPGSPQAAEARAALAAAGHPIEGQVSQAARREEGTAETLAMEPAEEPVVEEPGRDEPMLEEPAGEEPIVEEPVVERPAREEPTVVEEPARDEPVVDEPAVGEPAAGEPVYRPFPPGERPARVERAREEPAREEPEREEPAREEPALYERARPDPAREEPVADQEPPKFPAPAGAEHTLLLQVGAFTSATTAADLSKRLKLDGFPSLVEIAIVEGQGYYRVRVGPYRLPAEAEALRDAEARLSGMGYPTRQVAPGS